MTFSIIVPVFNVEKYLCACLDSILRQTFNDFELILVNDGSTDNSLDICKSYASKDNRIVLIDKQNGGSSSARNAGILKSSGDYFIFVDSDDLYLNSFGLENIYKAIQTHQNSVIMWKYKKDFFESAKCFDKQITSCVILKDNKEKIKEIKNGHLIATAWCYCIPKQFFSKELLFKENETSEDVEWFFELLKKDFNIIVLDDELYGYRIRKDSVSSNISSTSVFFLEKHLDYMIDYIKSNDFKNELLNVYLGEQVANYYIVLSKTSFKSGNVNKYKEYLKYTKRKRSKLIKIFSRIFGITATIKMLRRMK